MRPPVPIQTPANVSPVVWQALARITPNPQPIQVPVRTEAYCVAGECHRNVTEKINRDGGSIQHGWVAWEIPPWEIQAEFHFVWQAHDGSLVDVTPPLHGGPCVLFLPDQNRIYEGRNIPGIHHPYSDSAHCREYIEIVTAQEKILYPPGGIHDNQREVPMNLLVPLIKRMQQLFLRGVR